MRSTNNPRACTVFSFHNRLWNTREVKFKEYRLGEHFFTFTNLELPKILISSFCVKMTCCVMFWYSWRMYSLSYTSFLIPFLVKASAVISMYLSSPPNSTSPSKQKEYLPSGTPR